MISWETLVFFPQSATKYLAIQDVIKKKKKNQAQSKGKNRKQYVFAYKGLQHADWEKQISKSYILFPFIFLKITF